MPEFKHQTPKGGMFLYGGFEDKKIDTFFILVQKVFKKRKLCMFQQISFI